MSSPAIRRGDIFCVDWNPARGSEQAGRFVAVSAEPPLRASVRPDARPQSERPLAKGVGWVACGRHPAQIERCR